MGSGPASERRDQASTSRRCTEMVAGEISDGQERQWKLRWVTATEGRWWQRSSCDVASVLMLEGRDAGSVYRRFGGSFSPPEAYCLVDRQWGAGAALAAFSGGRRPVETSVREVRHRLHKQSAAAVARWVQLAGRQCAQRRAGACKAARFSAGGSAPR